MRVVIKVGTSTLAYENTGLLHIRRMKQLCEVLSDIKNAGHEVILVSSGAIGMGMGKLGLDSKPHDLPGKQACAAIGQCELMYTYDSLFSQYNHIVGQILITKADVENEDRKTNFINTMEHLLKRNVLPIVNENDTIATEEIVIGDNDNLGAILAKNIHADLYIILSDIDGLYDDDPHKNENAKLIPVVYELDEKILSFGQGVNSNVGTGGMKTKLEAATQSLMLCDETKKNEILEAMAQSLLAHKEDILNANLIDLEKAVVSDVMKDRLKLNDQRLNDMAQGILDVVKLSDPTGKVLNEKTLENGLVIQKVSVPLGVIAIIYESRPNVTSDAATLCIKSGNTCILRIGKEAWNSANAIVQALQEGIQKCGVNPNIVQLIQDTTHQSANELMEGVGYIDLLIPRGGKNLISRCVEHAKVPCIQTGTGICHIYVDDEVNQDMTIKIIENAKCSRPSVCNAEEVLLVHSKIANEFLPKLKKQLDTYPVELRLDDRSQKIIEGTKATADDFDTEFLDYILAIKIVDSVEEAIEHISKHSTKHSESILTTNKEHAKLFTQSIDSAAVYVNCSTRFTDGGQFGLGCEIGISTQKLHARGPMGLEELTTYKYIVQGNGQIR